jgi:hypothetical protein
MAEAEKYNARGSFIGRIWATSLVRWFMALAGLAIIIAGYGMILNPSDAADVEVVTHRAVGGMMLVFCGGVIEVLVLLGWSKR